MKFLAVTLLAVCLVQGNSAQLISSLVDGASKLVNGVVSTADKAVNTDLNSATSAVSDGVQSLLNQVASGGSLDKITSLASSLTAEELQAVVEGAAKEVTAQVNAAKGTLDNATSSLSESGQGAIVNALDAAAPGLGTGVRASLKSAAAVGVDVRECLLRGTQDSGNVGLYEGTKCFSDLTNKTATLAEKLVGLVPRSVSLVLDSRSGYKTCQAKSNTILRTACHGTVVAPVVAKTAILAKDSVVFSAEALKFATTLGADVNGCVDQFTTPTLGQALKLTASVLSCLGEKALG